MAHVVDLEARRAQLLGEIELANEGIRAIDALLRVMDGDRGARRPTERAFAGSSPPGKRQRTIRGRPLLRDVVLGILASAPGRMQTAQIKASLCARGREQADEDLRGVLKKLRDKGGVEFVKRPGTLGYQYWLKAGRIRSGTG